MTFLDGSKKLDGKTQKSKKIEERQKIIKKIEWDNQNSKKIEGIHKIVKEIEMDKQIEKMKWR